MKQLSNVSVCVSWLETGIIPRTNRLACYNKTIQPYLIADLTKNYSQLSELYVNHYVSMKVLCHLKSIA